MVLLKKINSLLIVVIIAFCFIQCSPFQEEKMAWQTYMDEIGSYSSTRVADLNQDGVMDIIMGAGGRENNPTDTAVFALDGTNGKILWIVPGVNQFVGSAIFKDINKDGVPDVFIGGRWSELFSISGKDGKIIWKFFPQRTSPNPADSGWYNFTSPQFIPDQDQDGLEDILIGNGGNPSKLPYEIDRPAGRLLVLSSATGKIIVQAEVPDKKETYMSVLCVDLEGEGLLSIIFGTGGETIPGHLYKTSLEDLMKGDISKAKILASDIKKGFIAPPAIADITNDGIYDIVVNAVDGHMLAIDGGNDSLLWKVSIPGTEAYTTPAVGYFTDDSIPDFFTNYGIGVYPTIFDALEIMVDGKTGAVKYRDTIGGFQYTCPIVADFNNDGLDEAMLNLNKKEMSRTYEDIYYSHMLVFDFHHHNNTYVLGDTLVGTNNASTPWVGDLDHDNKMDIVYSSVNYKKIRLTLEKPRGLYVALWKTNIPIHKPIVWGAYLGSNYNGIFPSGNPVKTKLSSISQ